jgi:peptide/nickel transport system substrate-binding protein
MASRRRSSEVDSRGPGWPLLAFLLAGVVILGGIVLWINNPLSSGDDRHTRYVEAIAGSPARANPIFAYANEADRDISALVFSGLTRLGPDGTPLPDLAERWDISDNGTTVTFHLRSGVKWHSGSPFTSDDVVFTYNLLREPALQADPSQAALWQSITCEAPDKLTVTCTLPEPYAPFLSYTTIGILPRSILSAVTPQTLLTDPFNRAPVGTGPYRLSSFDEKAAVLEANAEFYLGSPNIDEIELRFFPDMSSAAAEVIRGQADGILASLSIQPADYQSLRETGVLQSLVSSRSASTILYFNTEEPPLNDSNVRSAIASAVDVDAIITSLLGGRGLRTDTPIAPGTWAFSPDAHMPAYNVGMARQILDNAGWTLPSGASVRTKNDTEMRFSLLTDEDPLRGAVADAVAAQLAAVNIEATVVRQSSSDLVTDYLIPREYQVAIYGYDPGADPDPYPAWHSSQVLGSGRNIAGYRSDDADALLEEARRKSDQDERADLYADFQALFVEDRPSIPLYVPLNTYFQSAAVRNVQPGVLFTASARFRNVWEWSIEERSGVGGQ